MPVPRVLTAMVMLAAPLVFTTGLSAQDGNTLNRHLEHQQWQRLQDHQNQTRRMNARTPAAADTKRTTGAQSCSADALPAADLRQMEAEYVQRAKADGKASADAWVREQGKQFRLRLVAEGICTDPAEEDAVPRR